MKQKESILEKKMMTTSKGTRTRCGPRFTCGLSLPSEFNKLLLELTVYALQGEEEGQEGEVST